MKKIFFFAAVAALLIGCKEKPEGPQVIIEETTYEGEGKLQYFGEEGTFETNHTYKWACDSETKKISIDLVINLDDYNNEEYEGYQSWQIGSFTLPVGSINEFLGEFVGELDETAFYPVNPATGEQFEFNSYKPGCWLDENAAPKYPGVLCWQWYIWEGKTDMNGDTIGYDYSQEEYPGLFYVVAAPGTTNLYAGTTVVSENKLVAGDETYDFIITAKYIGAAYEVPEDSAPLQTAAKGEAKLYSLDMKTELATSSLKWDCSAEAFNFEATISLTEAADSYGVGYVKFDYSVFNDIIGMDICNTTLENFYALNPDGSIYEVTAEDGTVSRGWTSYAPGMWVDKDGTPVFSHSFWQLHAYADTQDQYYDIPVPGAFIVGQCPTVPVAGDVVVAKAMLTDIPWTVTFKYVE